MRQEEVGVGEGEEGEAGDARAALGRGREATKKTEEMKEQRCKTKKRSGEKMRDSKRTIQALNPWRKIGHRAEKEVWNKRGEQR